MYRIIPKEIKDQIMSRIKNEGVKASQAAEDAGINPKTVYGWLSQIGRVNEVSMKEYLKVKHENRELKEIIGFLTLNLEKGKKNKSGK